ncbi:dihydrofolate reductase [Enterobacteriaceae bacterium 89]|nr:dihydrofolate reductase [Enterobacteriaceae bacterium 89]
MSRKRNLRINRGLARRRKYFVFFTLPPVDERLCFPYSGGNFLHPGYFQ